MLDGVDGENQRLSEEETMTNPSFDPKLLEKVARRVHSVCCSAKGCRIGIDDKAIAEWHLSELRRVEEERDRYKEDAAHREIENLSLKDKLHISENEVLKLRLLTGDWIKVLKRIEHLAKPTCGDCTEIEAIANKALRSSNLKELGL